MIFLLFWAKISIASKYILLVILSSKIDSDEPKFSSPTNAHYTKISIWWCSQEKKGNKLLLSKTKVELMFGFLTSQLLPIQHAIYFASIKLKSNIFPSVFVFRDKGFVTTAQYWSCEKITCNIYITILFRLTYSPTLVFKLSQWSRDADFLKPEQKQRKLKRQSCNLAETLAKIYWTHEDIRGCKFRILPQNYIAMKTDTIRWIS